MFESAEERKRSSIAALQEVLEEESDCVAFLGTYKYLAPGLILRRVQVGGG